MSDFLPIQIRHLDETVDPLVESNLLPIVIGDEVTGFETRSTTLEKIYDFIDVKNQDSSIDAITVSNSAVIQNFLNVGDILSDTGNKLYVDGNVFISGSLSALSGVTFFSTLIEETSSLYLSGASGVCLKVNQYFDYPIAQFFDGENISLHIDGNYFYGGNVGIKTTTPNESFTVYGNISSSSNIYSDNVFNNTTHSGLLSSTGINVKDYANIGTSLSSTLNIGNSTSNVFIEGNLNLNSSVTGANTVIGNEYSDVYVNGTMFTKNISSSGDIFLNTKENETFTTTIGNISSINILNGTNVLSGSCFLNGDVHVNTEKEGNTYINATQNEGVVYIGNSSNSVEIKSKNITINTVLTSDYVYRDFTEYDSLTSALDDVFSTSTVVVSSIIVDSINPLLTSFQYKILESVNAQNLDLESKTAQYGSDQFITNLNGFVINLNSDSNMFLNCVSGGFIEVGKPENLTNLNGGILQINNINDGFLKDTYINNQEDSGSLYMGNYGGGSVLNGRELFINSEEPEISSANTFIGNVSSITQIHNLSVVGGITAVVSSFQINNIDTDNFITETLVVKQDSIFNGPATFTSYIDLSSVKLTSDVVTDPSGFNTTNTFIRVVVNGENKYIRLYDI